MKTAEAWQLSNAPVISMAVHLASLDIFDEIGMHNLRAKSKQLTAYQEFVIQDINNRNSSFNLEIITPSNPEDRGCQLSIVAHGQGKTLFEKLSSEGIVTDWREPNVIRIAPVPLYNSYEDVYLFGEILERSMDD